MSPWAQQSISFRLARAGVILAFALGAVLGLAQVVLDYFQEEKALEARIERILEVAARSATPAARRLDERLGLEIVDGLLKYEFIAAAKIDTDLGSLLAERRRPPRDSATDWITRNITTPTTEHLFELTDEAALRNDATSHYGHLTVVVDRDRALGDFYTRALYVLVAGIARNLLLALLLFALFQWLLARPLRMLVEGWSHIDPKDPGERRLYTPPEHRFDELGELTRRANDFLDASHAHLTKRKEVELGLIQAVEDAEAANQTKNRFLATMSHEIRTPMNVVVGLGDLLLEESLKESDPLQVERLQRMQSAANALLELINNILDLSSIEAGELLLEPHPFNPAELLHDTVGVYADAAAERGLRLTADHADELPPRLLGDAARVRQILLILVSNAIKFTEHGEVHVRMSWHDQLRISVEDSGIGIAPAQVERIFHAFTQADDSATRRYGGSGLGLSISHQLATLMGGELGVESRLGEGSRFLFTAPLPLAQSDDTPPPEATTPLRILLAEDSPDNQRLIQTYLRGTPHALEIVEDGDHAVSEACGGAYDLVLMDIQMPIMDGLNATRAIRAWEHEQQREPLRIIALTAHALEADHQRSLAAGCDHHLTKPIKKRDLLAAL